jgi:signal transduction histidine kinase
MKKHYIRLTAVIAALILTAFVLSLGLYTYAAATKMLNEKLDYAAGRASMAALKGGEDLSEDEVIGYIYGNLEEKTWFTKSDEIGFYEVVDIDENTRIESKSFIKAWTNSDDGKDTVENKRYILPGNDFKTNDIWFDNFEADAVCDSNFIFNGTFKYHDYSAREDIKKTIPYNSLASADDAVPVSEVFGDNRIDARYYTFETSKYESELNMEAKEILEGIRDKLEKGYASKVYTDDSNFYYHMVGNDSDELDRKIENGEYVVTRQINLWTTYSVDSSRINSSSYNAYNIYLFHPIGLAVRNHIIVYILSLLALIILEALAVFTMRKVYCNRMSYELMRHDLTRSIAHDLKTPLAVTKAYTENWEYIDDEDRHEYAEKLNVEVDNMAAMINNMLNMSKLDSEKDLKLEEVELYAMTSAIYERMKPLIAERGLKAKLITDVIGGKYYVKADPKMIKIAIGNFITNALKYAESKVEIKLLGKDKKVTFMVSNDGHGISKKEIKRIWEPFYKTDKARTDRMGSSGMGLAINSSILRLHKAKYKCISDNTETSFWFELKRVK